MNAKAEKKLRGMMNKRFRYGQSELTVLDYDYNEEKGRIYVYTDRKQEPYDRPADEAMSFLDQFEPIDNPTLQVVVKGLMLSESNLGITLKDVLLENIEKIKNDAGYIPQAEAINNNVKSLIDLAKTEVAYLKAFNSNIENKA